MIHEPVEHGLVGEPQSFDPILDHVALHGRTCSLAVIDLKVLAHLLDLCPPAPIAAALLPMILWG